jgi:hypothetical protein
LLSQLPSLIQQLQEKKSSVTEEIELISENIADNQQDTEGEDAQLKVYVDLR